MECVLRHQHRNSEHSYEEEDLQHCIIQHCVIQLCAVPVNNIYFGTKYNLLVIRQKEVIDLPVEDESLWLKRMLLSAAACIDEDELVQDRIGKRYNWDGDQYVDLFLILDSYGLAC